MDLDKFSSFWDLITSAGAILIPFALYVVRNEITKQGTKIENKLDKHIQKFEDHVESDEEFQRRNEKSLDSIKNRLNII